MRSIKNKVIDVETSEAILSKEIDTFSIQNFAGRFDPVAKLREREALRSDHQPIAEWY